MSAYKMVATYRGTSLSICNESYQNVLQTLFEIKSCKSQISSLVITDCLIGQLRSGIFDGFKDLIDLDLSKCSIHKLDRCVFDNLIHLTSIQLSYNFIATINRHLFVMNDQLRVINVANNLLNSIDKTMILNLKNLETFDLSYNFIVELSDEFLINCNLKQLYLNNCHIKELSSTCFSKLCNLVHLSLNNNKIEQLENDIFKQLANLKFLNLNTNFIREIHRNCFSELSNLEHLNLSNNLLTLTIDKFFFCHQTNLIELDLSDNNTVRVFNNAFVMCANLKILKLMVIDKFESASVKKLQSLETFELVFKQTKFYLTSVYWTNFKNMKLLNVLKLTFFKVVNLILCDFSSFSVLEYLHIEYVEPNETKHDINLSQVFPKMTQLKTLILRKLNSFTVSQYTYGSLQILELNLTGVKNRLFGSFFSSFAFLEYLDLSFSEIEIIAENTFKELINLEHLQLGYSKLKLINAVAFKYNCKLEVLNCYRSLIETIEDFSFANLCNLQLLDLSYNNLTTISENAFFGLNMDTCIILM